MDVCKATFLNFSVTSDEAELDKYEIKINLARGEGNISSSSSEEEESEIEKDEDNVNDEISEGIMDGLNRTVRKIEWASNRIAICNLEWDRLQAIDLIMVLNSFKPETGKLLTVSIYLSDFGKERLDEENIKGPHLKNEEDDQYILF